MYNPETLATFGIQDKVRRPTKKHNTDPTKKCRDNINQVLWFFFYKIELHDTIEVIRSRKSVNNRQ